jgi:hypothetical protein
MAVNGCYLTFAVSIPSGLAFRAAGFFLARTRVFYPERDVGKFKIAVGTLEVGGLNGPESRSAGRARSDPDFIRSPEFRRAGTARSYPNVIRGSSGLARFRFPGHVDDHANKINSPEFMRSSGYTMPAMGIEDAEVGKSGHRDSGKSFWKLQCLASD